MALERLRLCYQHLGRTLPIIASSASADFPATNLETGDLQRYWQATALTAQYLGYDATLGLTQSPNTLILPGADYLVANGFNVDVRWSTDGSPVGTSIGALTNGVSAFPWTPITSAHLVAPYARDAVAEWTAVAKRGWYLHLYGTVTVPAQLPGAWFLGTRTELPTSPALPGRGFGATRTYRGRDLEMSWPPMSFANARILADLIAALTDDASDPFTETIGGVGYGGVPAWFYDRAGTTFNALTGLPFALPVLCATPGQASTVSLTPSLEAPPVSVRWRERR